MSQKGFTPILIVILLTATLMGGYLIYQKQGQPKTVINPAGYSGPSPEKVLRLKSHDECKEDKKLCKLLSEILKNVESGDYSSLSNQQEIVEKTCITGGLLASVCQGAKEREIRKGYMIGSQNAEYDIVSGNRYVAWLNGYFISNAPLDYEETIISTNRASVVYSNKIKQNFLIFNLHKNESYWKIQDVLIGSYLKEYLKTYYPTLE